MEDVSQRDGRALERKREDKWSRDELSLGERSEGRVDE
jgi:hypothetical protein